MPSVLLSNLGSWKADLQVFTDLYAQDLPNPAGLSAELFVWEGLWIDKRDNAEDIPDKIAMALKFVHRESFPNVFTVLQILATVPVTSCSCERSIFSLRYLKNYLRSTMKVARLNGLALMHAHREIPLDLDQLIDKFALLHPRRMRMANILDEDNST